MPCLLRRFMVLAAALLVTSGVARGALITYTATLSGPAESPPKNSPGSGTAEVDIDVEAHTLYVHVDFADLTAGTTASHIHAPTAIPGQGTAGVATQVPTFPNFPLGVTSGTYDQTFDTSQTSTYNPTFLNANGGTAAGAEAALASSLAAGTAYLNIHTTDFPGGEIRGFLVPEPSTGLVLLGIALLRRRVA
jgi:hypothetical protein